MFGIRPNRRNVTRRTFLKWLSVGVAAGSLPIVTGCSQQKPCSLNSLNIIPRSDWGAIEPDLNALGEHGLYDADSNPDGWLIYDEPLSQVLNTIVVHHSALPLSDGPFEIQQKHMQQKGFADIGYHFLIDDAGQIYEGRNLSVRGAHTGGHNTGTVGIALLGNFEETPPLDSQITSLKTLARCLSDEHEISHLAGHKDFQPDETVCPGKKLEPILPDLADEMQLEFGTGGYKGPQR